MEAAKQFPTHIVAVDGVVANDRGEILLVRQRGSGAWTVPGGQVETGENLMEALQREIREESGAEVTVDKLICISSNTVSYPGYGGYAIVPTKLMLGFTCTYTGGALHDSDETAEARWVPRDTVLDYITTPPLVERFRAYLDYDGSVRYLSYATKPEYRLDADRQF